MTQIPLPAFPASDIQRDGVMVCFGSDDNDAPDYRGWVRDALRMGSFHVHRTVYGSPRTQDVGGTQSGFTVTHSLSGVAVARGVRTVEAACELAAFMQALPLAWDTEDFRAIRASAGPRLRSEIRARIAASGGRP